MFFRKIVLGTFFFLLIINSGIAQIIDAETLLKHESTNNASEYYAQSIGAFFHLYNGREYIEADRFIIGHTFYGEDDWVNGDLIYDGIYFKDIPLKYDILNDVVVAKLRHESYYLSNVSLHNELIEYLTIQGKKFYMVNGHTSRPQLCELLFDGAVKAIARREKILDERLEGSEIIREFKERNYHYVLKEDHFYAISSKGSLMKVYEERKKDIRHLLKEKGINFRKQKDLAIILATQLYSRQK